jgi:cyclopropane-fatty-acyl-phospholipid synthase
MSLIARTITAFEAAPLPDSVRRGAVSMLVERVRRQMRHAPSNASAAFAEEMRTRPIAEHTADANAQHYEVPAELFLNCLGPNLKYSSCRYDKPADTLEQAEIRALGESCANADLRNGQDILELGCGWGSLTVWMAKAYPQSRITAVSN